MSGKSYDGPSFSPELSFSYSWELTQILDLDPLGSTWILFWETAIILWKSVHMNWGKEGVTEASISCDKILVIFHIVVIHYLANSAKLEVSLCYSLMAQSTLVENSWQHINGHFSSACLFANKVTIFTVYKRIMPQQQQLSHSSGQGWCSVCSFLCMTSAHKTVPHSSEVRSSTSVDPV